MKYFIFQTFQAHIHTQSHGHPYVSAHEYLRWSCVCCRVWHKQTWPTRVGQLKPPCLPVTWQAFWANAVGGWCQYQKAAKENKDQPQGSVMVGFSPVHGSLHKFDIHSTNIKYQLCARHSNGHQVEYSSKWNWYCPCHFETRSPVIWSSVRRKTCLQVLVKIIRTLIKRKTVHNLINTTERFSRLHWELAKIADGNAAFAMRWYTNM